MPGRAWCGPRPGGSTSAGLHLRLQCSCWNRAMAGEALRGHCWRCMACFRAYVPRVRVSRRLCDFPRSPVECVQFVRTSIDVEGSCAKRASGALRDVLYMKPASRPFTPLPQGCLRPPSSLGILTVTQRRRVEIASSRSSLDARRHLTTRHPGAWPLPVFLHNMSYFYALSVW